MFEFDTNIFPTKTQDPAEVAKKSLTRTESAEFKIIEKNLKSIANQEEEKATNDKDRKYRDYSKDYSPEKINKILKTFPPFASDKIPVDDLTRF